jgi:hypothetical protein
MMGYSGNSRIVGKPEVEPKDLVFAGRGLSFRFARKNEAAGAADAAAWVMSAS